MLACDVIIRLMIKKEKFSKYYLRSICQLTKNFGKNYLLQNNVNTIKYYMQVRNTDLFSFNDRSTSETSPKNKTDVF